jgi:AraC-like DNA-binding protein
METTNLGEYRQLMTDAVVPLDATANDGVPFFGSIDSYEVDRVTIMHVRSVPQTVRRTQAGCRRSPSDLVKVLVQRTGQADAEQQGRQTQLGPLSLTLYDTSAPYEVIQRAPFVADAILVPRDRMLVWAAATAVLQERPLPTDRGAGALFVSYLDELRVRIRECSPEEAGRCTSILLELLQAVVAESAVTSLSGSAMRVSIVDWINRHLDDEELRPATIAAANGISVRYLHSLFEDSGTSVSGYIRSQRMRRIRDDLVDPTLRRRTIAAIGARWGIPDPAHLNRLFRAEFALTPGAVRRQACAPAARGRQCPDRYGADLCMDGQDTLHGYPTSR